MSDRLNDVDPAMAGTCQWLLQHDTFRAWASSDRSLLWIKGKPGSGKSTLMKFALHNVEKVQGLLLPDDRAVVFSFFFHSRGHDLQKSPLGFWKALLHCFFQVAPESLADLVRAHEEKNKSHGEHEKAWDWHQEELRSAFEKALPDILKSHRVLMYVDALDECAEQYAKTLVKQFKALLCTESHSTRRFNIIFSCRHYPIISQDEILEVDPSRENNKDISSYVRKELAHIADNEQWTTVSDLVTSRANGVFLWAHLVVQQILEQDDEGEEFDTILEGVSDIPQQLDNFYNMIVRMAKEKPDSWRLFQWVCCAFRPLTVVELPWVMAIDPDAPQKSFDKCKRSRMFISQDRLDRRIKALGYGLVETVAQERGPPVVQFIHQSVKDFFLEQGLQTLDDAASTIEMATSFVHCRLAKATVSCLAMEELWHPELDPDALCDYQGPYPLRYATEYWGEHAKKSDREWLSQEYLMRLFEWPSPLIVRRCGFLTFSVIYGGCDDSVILGECDTDTNEAANLLHLATSWGLHGLVSLILEKASPAEIDVDARDGLNQTALHIAVKKGNVDLVMLFLKFDHVDVDQRDGKGRTPLSWAAAGGFTSIVHLLLDTKKVDIDSADHRGYTPLSRATWEGHEAIVTMLLDTGQVDIAAQYSQGNFALVAAADSGHVTIFRQLVHAAKNYVNLDCHDHSGMTPLTRAVERDDTDMAELLLKSGMVDINARTLDGQTALFDAVMSELADMVELLLSFDDVDVNARSNECYGMTPCSFAAREGCESIVKLLLDTSKVDVNARDDFIDTPLSLAVSSGHATIVEMLLATGEVDLDQRNGHGETPLELAAEKFYPDIVGLLLDAGARWDSSPWEEWKWRAGMSD